MPSRESENLSIRRQDYGGQLSRYPRMPVPTGHTPFNLTSSMTSKDMIVKSRELFDLK